MPNFDIDFEWWRDPAGYRLQPPRPGKPAAPMMHPDFKFPVGPSLLGDDPGQPARIVRRGGTLVRYRPLETIDNLCVIFAKTVKAVADLHTFIGLYGPLTADGLDEKRGEAVPLALEQARIMRGALGGKGRSPRGLSELIGAEGAHLTNLDVNLYPEPTTGGIRLRISPRSLLHAMWLQLGQILSGAGTIKRCQQCGGWFEAGPGSKRRLDAKFCSDEHRVTFNSHKRSRAGELPRRRRASKRTIAKGSNK